MSVWNECEKCLCLVCFLNPLPTKEAKWRSDVQKKRKGIFRESLPLEVTVLALGSVNLSSDFTKVNRQFWTKASGCPLNMEPKQSD